MSKLAFASTIVLASSLAALVACGGTAPESTGSGDGAVVASPAGSHAPAPAKGAASAGSSGTGSAGKGAATDGDGGAGGKGNGGVDPNATPDPACVTSCETNLKAKCMGDATFCDDVCGSYDATEIACLVAAPACDKPTWLACETAGGTGDAGTSKTK